jgi:hypothetical protein
VNFYRLYVVTSRRIILVEEQIYVKENALLKKKKWGKSI